MKRGPLFVASLFLLSPLLATGTLDQALIEMEAHNKTVKNIQFDFRQEIQFFNTNGVSEVTGAAAFQKPGQMRIEKKKPENQLTISNGKKMWVYTPAYKQVWVGSANHWAGASFLPKGIIPMDNYVKELTTNFKMKLKSGGGATSELWISAEPKNPDLGYRMEMLISTTTWLPVKTVFQSDTAKIVTELLNTKINLDIPNATFRFLPPKGTEVIPL